MPNKDETLEPAAGQEPAAAEQPANFRYDNVPDRLVGRKAIEAKGKLMRDSYEESEVDKAAKRGEGEPGGSFSSPK